MCIHDITSWKISFNWDPHVSYNLFPWSMLSNRGIRGVASISNMARINNYLVFTGWLIFDSTHFYSQKAWHWEDSLIVTSGVTWLSDAKKNVFMEWVLAMFKPAIVLSIIVHCGLHTMKDHLLRGWLIVCTYPVIYACRFVPSDYFSLNGDSPFVPPLIRTYAVYICSTTVHLPWTRMLPICYDRKSCAYRSEVPLWNGIRESLDCCNTFSSYRIY